jgi:hypothetical protein
VVLAAGRDALPILEEPVPHPDLTPATSIEEIRRRGQAPIALQLIESGAVVHLRRPTAMELVAQGVIPDHLSGQLLKGLEDISDAKQAGEFVDLINAVCCAALVSPRMVQADMPSLGIEALTPDDLPFADRLLIHQVVMRAEGVFHLARFPSEQDGDVAPAEDGAGVLDEAERAPRV